MDKISIDYKHDMSFEANIENFSIALDAKSENGGSASAPTPKPLMLVALAGCTGMDVASLAKKMRVELEKFEIEATASKSDTMPVVYTAAALKYNFIAAPESAEKIRKIVGMSQERYCGVAAMFRMICPLSYTIWLNGEQI
ncbi:MAG: OsmC family protein [Mucinivorans sp.]